MNAIPLSAIARLREHPDVPVGLIIVCSGPVGAVVDELRRAGIEVRMSLPEVAAVAIDIVHDDITTVTALGGVASIDVDDDVVAFSEDDGSD